MEQHQEILRYGQLFDNNPAAAATLDKSTMAFYGKVYDYSRAGVPEDKAVDMAYSQVFQQDDRMKQMLSTAMRDKKYVAARATAAQNNASSLTSISEITRQFTMLTLYRQVAMQNRLRK